MWSIRLVSVVAAGAIVVAAPSSTAIGAGSTAPPAPHVLVALGDSITSAWGSGVDSSGTAIPDDNTAASWATGSDSRVLSHAQRITAAYGIQTLAVDLARPGRKMTSSDGIQFQATQAPAGTDYVMILSGSADLCGSDVTSVAAMTTVADFTAGVRSTLQTITTAFPNAHVLIASIPNWYALWQATPTQTRPDGTCPLLFSTDPTIANATSRAAVQQRTIDFNQALATTCAAFAACKYDGGAVYALSFGAGDNSTYDHFHPSVSGQAKIAAATWAASWWAAAVAPSNQTPPSVQGPAVVGSTLTGSEGAWAGSPTPTRADQWLRCTSSCAPIAGATSLSYAPATADVGATLKLQVTGTNSAGSLVAVSSATAAVQPRATAPPSATALPTISGIAQVNQVLTATNGTWANNPTSFIGQWQRCTSSTACTDISGATSGLYVVASQDVGSTVRFRLTAQNAVGSTTASSAASAVVTNVPNPLALDVLVDGASVYTTAVDRNGIAYGTGASASDPRNRLYRSFDEGRTWQQLYDFPEGSDVSGVISVLRTNTLIASVTIQAVMHLFRSADGGVTWTDVFQFLPGYQTLSAASISSDGTYVYLGSYNVLDGGDHVNWVWRSSDDGQTWAVVRETSTHRHIHFVDVDPTSGYVYVGYGDSPDQSAIERSTDRGATWQTLCTGAECTVVDMDFDPSGFAIFGTDHPSSPSFVERMNLATGAVTPIAGLVGASYSTYNLGGGVWLVGVTREPAGTYPADDPNVHLYASNDGGKTFVKVLDRPITDMSSSAELSVHFAFPSGDFPITVTQPGASTLVARPHSTRPIDKVGPGLSGTASTGSPLTATSGTWTGAGTITYAYQWQRCPVGGICTDISGATASTYRPVVADRGFLLRARVTASNAGGGTPAFTPQSAAVADAPLSVTSSIADGQQLAGTVAWTATVTTTKTVASVAFAVDGTVASTDTTAPYAVNVDTTSLTDGTHRFTVTATATDGATASVTATATVSNPAIPRNTSLPRVIGILRVGGLVLASSGSWTNSPTSYAFQWQRCSSAGTRCVAIGGATGSLYRPVSADAGSTLRVVVTASNRAGSSSATSDATSVVTR